MDREQMKALSDGYDALSGVKPLEAIAKVLREGWHTPDFLKAIANRLDPTYEGQWDDYRLVLVSRDTLGPINDRTRAERLEMVLDVVNTYWRAQSDPKAIMKNVVADLCDKWGVKKSTVYAITKGLKELT